MLTRPSAVDARPPSADQFHEEIMPDNSTFHLNKLPMLPGLHHPIFGSGAVTDLSEDIPDSEFPVRTGNGRNNRRLEVDDDENKEHAHMRSYHAPAKRLKGQQQLVKRQVNDESVYPGSSQTTLRNSHTALSCLTARAPSHASRHLDLDWVDKYTRSVEKWQACTLEEWRTAVQFSLKGLVQANAGSTKHGAHTRLGRRHLESKAAHHGTCAVF
ncbi:hypothetical protein C8R44DRAFT_729238 [Mycena epipterygia]|nr:hypothetical protein C8R44DRAFT_729238 [Mycena epipterygia]